MEESECKICNRKFETRDGLMQHNRDKHSSKTEEKETSRKSMKKYFLLGTVFLAIILFIVTFYVRSQKPGALDDFAKCLTEKGAVIYGNDFCQYTTKQLNMFGNSKKYLNYVKCIDNKELCDSKSVKITPTWEIDGKMYEGVQDFERLSALSGCKLE